MAEETDTSPGTRAVLRRRQDGVLDLAVITGFVVGLLAESAPTVTLRYVEPATAEVAEFASAVKDIQIMLSPVQAEALARSLLDAAGKSIA